LLRLRSLLHRVDAGKTRYCTLVNVSLSCCGVQWTNAQ